MENIQRVTQGYLWKTYSELRKDTLSKYTASYAWIREENIQRVTQRYVCKTYSQLHNQPSNTTCHLLLRASAQYVPTLRKFSRAPYSRQYLLMFTSIPQLNLQGFVLKSLQISCSIQLQFITNISTFISTNPYLLQGQHMCTTCHSFYTSVGFVFRFIFSVPATFSLFHQLKKLYTVSSTGMYVTAAER